MTEVAESQTTEAEVIGKEILAAIQAAKSSETVHKVGSVEHLMEHASPSLKKRLAGRDLTALNVDDTDFPKGKEPELLEGRFKCTVCTTGLTLGIAAALGGGIILTGGMSIPAVLAASAYSMSGLAVVISAMTGVSVGAVTALLTAAGTTLSIVCLGLCEAMGAC